MKKIHAIIAGIIVVIAMNAGIMYGVKAGNAVVPVVSFLAGCGLLILITRRISTVIEDEWTRLVEQKAATLALYTTMCLFTVIGLVLATISTPEQNYDQAMYAIAAFVGTLSLVLVAATLYYSRTLRGTGP